MTEYRDGASIYSDLHTPDVVRRSLVKEPGYSTDVHLISCESIEDLYEVYIDRYGKEFCRLGKHPYLYAVIDGILQRITD